MPISVPLTGGCACGAMLHRRTILVVVTGMFLVAFLLVAPSLTYSGDQEEANKSLTQRFAEELWNQGQASLIGDFVTVDIVVHGPGFPDMKGLEAFTDSYALFRTTPQAQPPVKW